MKNQGFQQNVRHLEESIHPSERPHASEVQNGPVKTQVSRLEVALSVNRFHGDSLFHAGARLQSRLP